MTPEPWPDPPETPVMTIYVSFREMGPMDFIFCQHPEHGHHEATATGGFYFSGWVAWSD